MAIRVETEETQHFRQALLVMAKMVNWDWPVKVIVGHEGLSFVVVDPPNDQERSIKAILLLRNTACSVYEVPLGETAVYMAETHEILESILEQDSLIINKMQGALAVNLEDSVTWELRMFPLQVIEYNPETYPYNVPYWNIEEQDYTVEGGIEPERLIHALSSVMTVYDSYNLPIFSQGPVEVYMSSTEIQFFCQTSGNDRYYLQTQEAQCRIDGVEEGQEFHLSFPLERPLLLFDAAYLSKEVILLIDGQGLKRPLFSCPYGDENHDLGSIFFIGSNIGD